VTLSKRFMRGDNFVPTRLTTRLTVGETKRRVVLAIEAAREIADVRLGALGAESLGVGTA